MKFAVFPSFRRNGSVVQLSDFVSVVPDNTWIWSVLDFYGIGKPPDSLSMEEFEGLVRSKPTGFIMTWFEFKDFAVSLDQTFDCLIVAAISANDITGGKSEKENFDNCEIVIEAFDSTEWSVWARDTLLMDKLASVMR